MTDLLQSPSAYQSGQQPEPPYCGRCDAPLDAADGQTLHEATEEHLNTVCAWLIVQQRLVVEPTNDPDGRPWMAWCPECLWRRRYRLEDGAIKGAVRHHVAQPGFHPVAGQPCTVPGQTNRHPSRIRAWDAATALRLAGSDVVPFQCACSWWHVTSPRDARRHGNPAEVADYLASARAAERDPVTWQAAAATRTRLHLRPPCRLPDGRPLPAALILKHVRFDGEWERPTRDAEPTVVLVAPAKPVPAPTPTKIVQAEPGFPLERILAPSGQVKWRWVCPCGRPAPQPKPSRRQMLVSFNTHLNQQRGRHADLGACPVPLSLCGEPEVTVNLVPGRTDLVRDWRWACSCGFGEGSGPRAEVFIAAHLHAVTAHPAITVPVWCHKRRYTDEDAAREALRETLVARVVEHRHRRREARTYDCPICPGHRWHLTSSDPPPQAYLDALRADVAAARAQARQARRPLTDVPAGDQAARLAG